MPPITLSVVPLATPGDSDLGALTRLCDELAKLLDTQVHGMHPESYGALASELERDRVQYAWMPPALVVLASEDVRIQPLLTAVRGDRTEYQSALFVPEESAIARI